MDTPCWFWIRGRGNGYGTMLWNGRLENAHRIAWILTYGPIPDKLHVLHRCDVKLCCRPDHLFLGNQGDNMRDYTQKGLRQKGEQHSQAKLTTTQVLEIRRRAAEEQTPTKVLSQQFGMSLRTIQAIIRRETWSHL